MAVTLFLRTDGLRQVQIVSNAVNFHLTPFPQPSDSVLVCTQLLNGGTVQEVSHPIPADYGEVVPLGIGCQTLEESMGLPRTPGAPNPTRYHTAGYGIGLLPAGVGMNAVRLKLLDGVTVVFDQTFPY